MNRLSNVKVVALALANETGLAGFTLHRGKSENSLVVSDDSPLVVPTMTVDELVATRGFPAPSLIKLDVEGAESSVLEGAQLTLERHRPVVFVALHGKQQQEACRLILESLDYELFALDGTGVAKTAIDPDEVYALPAETASAREC